MNAHAIPPTATLDLETYQLTLSLKEALDAPQSRLDRLTEISRRLCEHLLEHHRRHTGDTPGRSALAPWQERRAKEILARSLTARLSIADVARQCAMSRSHFSRAFKKATGMSPQEWSLDVRIRRAKELLGDRAMSVAQVAQDCGFADQSHFNRTFSKLVGTTPKRWQRLNALRTEPA